MPTTMVVADEVNYTHYAHADVCISECCAHSVYKHFITGGCTDEGSNRDSFGDGEAKSGVTTPVFAVTTGGYIGSTRKREVSIHQVGTCGGSGMPIGLIVDGKCVTCKNSNGRCVHRSVFEKSQGSECAGNPVTL